jgi:hypothetical protein
LWDLQLQPAHPGGASGNFGRTPHSGEHIRGFADDTVSCTQPWFHKLPFAAGKRPESNLDDVIATPDRIEPSGFDDIPSDRRFFVVP